MLCVKCMKRGNHATPKTLQMHVLKRFNFAFNYAYQNLNANLAKKLVLEMP